MRIGLFGNFGGGNLGNEGSLEAMIRFLQRSHSGAGLVCLCVEPAAVTARYGIEALALSTPREGGDGLIAKLRARLADHLALLRNIRNLAVLLVPGTGILDDFGERPMGFPYTLFLVCLIARLRGIPVAFVSVGAGPIRHPLSRWLMKTGARMARYRSYRDEISKDYMTGLGLDTRQDPVYPDLAFSLPDPAPSAQRTGNSLRVGLGLMTYFGWTSDEGRYRDLYDDYISKMTRLAVWLLQQGHSIRLLVGDTPDSRALEDVERGIAREFGEVRLGAVIAKTPRSLHDLMAQMSTVDAVIATRFHNVLCALKAGKPTISLSYARKNDVLMKLFGLESFCQHIETFEVDPLLSQFGDLRTNLAGYADMIVQTNTRLRAELEEQERLLSTKLISPSRSN
jgi:polysaccharide pyruvyl transferase WcaK-like protein